MAISLSGMRLAVLGSGSGGNATLVKTSEGVFMIDAGLSAKQLTLRMESCGVSPADLAGILVTHEHGDHTRGLEVFIRKNNVPIYATALTHEVLAQKLPTIKNWRLFEAGQSFSLCGVEVASHRIPHDAVDPVAFSFRRGEAHAALLTDLGHANERLMDSLRGVQTMVLESNYCDQLLAEDDKRPWSLKQRISSRHGHLSNEQALTIARELQSCGLSRVILGHLSRDCNTSAVARSVFEKLELTELVVAEQDVPSSWMDVEGALAEEAVKTIMPFPSLMNEKTGQIELDFFSGELAAEIG